jgi:hypothetical protein
LQIHRLDWRDGESREGWQSTPADAKGTVSKFTGKWNVETQEVSMPESKSVWNLIAIPALITLAVTILRLVGELQHWPSVLFSTKAGGGGAIVGISWLPIIFGPWFAVKLVGEGKGPASGGKAMGFAFFGFLVFVGTVVWVALAFKGLSMLLLLPFGLMLVAAFIPGIGWKALGKTLLAYALAARIPLLIVYFLAIRGSWGTHYDAIDPSLAQASFAKKYIEEALLPQMTLWIGWTVVIGSVFGSIAGAIKGRGKAASQPAG